MDAQIDGLEVQELREQAEDCGDEMVIIQCRASTILALLDFYDGETEEVPPVKAPCSGAQLYHWPSRSWVLKLEPVIMTTRDRAAAKIMTGADLSISLRLCAEYDLVQVGEDPPPAPLRVPATPTMAAELEALCVDAARRAEQHRIAAEALAEFADGVRMVLRRCGDAAPAGAQ